MGIVAWLIIAAILYVFGSVMRLVGELRGFRNGCAWERRSNHRRAVSHTRAPRFWIGYN